VTRGGRLPEKLGIPIREGELSCSGQETRTGRDRRDAERTVVGLDDYGVPVELVDAPTMTAALEVLSERVGRRAA
jgi:hypothetical protein